MTRGFEHRLWGYTVVKIKPPADVERGIMSDSTSSVHAPSPNESLHSQEMGEYGKLGIVDPAAEGRPTHEEDYSAIDRRDGGNADFGNGDLAVRPVPTESRDGSEEGEERGGWQIPETILLRSGSIAPF